MFENTEWKILVLFFLVSTSLNRSEAAFLTINCHYLDTCCIITVEVGISSDLSFISSADVVTRNMQLLCCCVLTEMDTNEEKKLENKSN